MSQYNWSSECVPLAYRGPPTPTKLSYKESADAVTKKCPECGDTFSGGDIISRPGCSGGCWCWYHLSCCKTMSCSKQPCSCCNCGGQLCLNSMTVLERFEIAVLPPLQPSSTTSTPPSSPDSYAADSPPPTPPFETESPFYRQQTLFEQKKNKHKSHNWF